MIKEAISKYKVWLTRLQTYLGPINFIMLLYLYVVSEPLGIHWGIWVLLLTSMSFSLLYVDIKYIFPNAQRYTTNKNPVIMEMHQDIKTIKKRLEND